MSELRQINHPAPIKSSLYIMAAIIDAVLPPLLRGIAGVVQF
jgi:hypothetical protein